MNNLECFTLFCFIKIWILDSRSFELCQYLLLKRQAIWQGLWSVAWTGAINHQSSVYNCNLFLRLQYVINDRQNMDASENIMIIALVFVSFLKTILPIFWFLIRRVPWVGRDCLTWLYAFKYCLLMSLIQRRENTVSSLLSEVLMVLCFSVECQQTSVQTL